MRKLEAEIAKLKGSIIQLNGQIADLKYEKQGILEISEEKIAKLVKLINMMKPKLLAYEKAEKNAKQSKKPIGTPSKN